MGMMDLYTAEQAAEALDDAIKTKAAYVEEIEGLNGIIFLLKYFLATGECLDPEVVGIPEPEEGDSDE